MNSGHVLRVLSLKFPKDGSSLVPGSRAEICVPLVAVLMSSHVSRPMCARVSSLLLIGNSASRVLTLWYMKQATAGVFTPQKLANDAATDQGFFLESRGLGRGLHTLSACPCCVATCLLFLKRPSVFQHVCCIFASRYDTLLFLLVLFGSFPSWLCHFL